MKIAILVHNLTNGGAERVAALWANGFDARGHKILVVLFDDKSPLTYLVSSAVKVVNVASHVNYRWLRVVKRIVKLRRVLQQTDPDVIIEVMPSFERRIAAFGLRCIKISTEHNPFDRPQNAEHKLNRLRKYFLNRFYDHVTVLTYADKEVIGKKLRHVSVLPNPLALKPAFSVPKKEKVVLAVGRKEDWHCKGFDILIKAWALLSGAYGWRLQIVGDSSNGGQDYLKQLCLECGVAYSVDFLEYQSDIQPYYERASVFVLSSRYEGFGLVLIEAMSQGCACVACDYKGRQSEIVTNGVDGLTCEPDNIEALAKAIKNLIVDDELRTILQEKAICRAVDFKVECIMDRWEEILRKCLAPPKKKER